MKTSILTLIAFVSILAASQANADSFSVVNIPNTTTNFGYLSAASNVDPLLINLNGPAVSINGANFAAGTATGTGAGGVTYALTGSNISAYSSYDAGATNTSVESLLSTFYYGGNSRDETLTINGLTPGRNVTLTVLGAAFGAGSTSAREEQITGSGGAVLANYEENNGMFSTLAYHVLVPNSGTISITSHATDGGGDTLHYYGFTLSTPEPSSFILGGLGAIGLLIAGRRRRKA